jgi:dUTP pyrophosphatase
MTPEEAKAFAQKMYEDTFKIEVEVMEGGKIPTKANPNDAGFDLYATSDITLYPGQVLKHPLNIKMKLPAGSWARIETKSGLGSKGMMVWAGVIDEGYRGVPHVIMSNIKMYTEAGLANNYPIEIKKGEKVAQMTMNPHANDFFCTQVESVSTDTSRGEGGFGSTGK